MVKSELIAQIANKQSHLSIKDIELGVNHLIDCMSNKLGDGHRIEIRGFGSFCLHYRPSRKAHNPKTGARVFTAAKYTPHFKPGKDLRDRVNESRAKHPIKDETGSDD
ncbi:MAG: integration host factor subunit beta [Gammaproteobacteria bacterium RIFCSPLOWO2_02_FULL_42_14]|nr:MAG: integration host factor subunit beta [Gammaproteobacteria bacterium RIFCSPHIGHO2_02_FULL_42_43]OGT28150.1 MAG: integration host factor subunit beta [Gammaproteobacteria bacterium RIFCSPHIGHO2_01_FULL_42_8]OGT51707.1 MAG: integration host factor subunit beta [Gammaproteobacteria bacterium RIFCSPHIGHO2_12_FULL_41_25]OGT61604.1 MAG: integration host factor subunit beta [Gammaproteobacteria bacterium RIFCSPLOWO2_02_FULL_42_14]OGT86228.1 MAG: integration host factor subunit beta [Gammaproteo